MKTILVTGGAGFIGSHLCKKLLEDNQVICIDNLLTSDENNLASFLDKPNYTFIKHDIIKPIRLSERIDEIYNLACPASPIDYQQFPIETLTVCSEGVRNVLDLAIKNKAKLLHTSTSEIYGDPSEHPQKEGYWGNVNPIGPRSCYDEGKRFAESIVENYRRKHKLDTKIIRIFNTYGPFMRPSDGRVVSTFICQALNEEPLEIFGDGQQTRSFCYVSDMVDGLIKMMQTSCSGPINVGNPNEVTVSVLATKILEMTESTSEIIYKPKRDDDPIKRRPDIALAIKQLEWKPKVNLDEGLEKTINWFEQSLSSERKE